MTGFIKHYAMELISKTLEINGKPVTFHAYCEWYEGVVDVQRVGFDQLYLSDETRNEVETWLSDYKNQRNIRHKIRNIFVVRFPQIKEMEIIN